MYVIRNGDWYLSEGPSWATSTWSMMYVDATMFRTKREAVAVRRKLVKYGQRPFGERPKTARVEKVKS